MPEIAPESAIAAAMAPRIVGPKDAPAPTIRLAEEPLGALWQVAAWPDHLPEAGAALAADAGIDRAPGPSEAIVGEGCRVLRTEPLKWWIVAAAPRPAPAVEPRLAARLDLGHARTALGVSGPRAGDLLARLFPLDFREAAFPAGRVATSGVHHVGVVIERRTEGFTLYLPRSFALSLVEDIVEIAAQFTVEIA